MLHSYPTSLPSLLLKKAGVGGICLPALVGRCQSFAIFKRMRAVLFQMCRTALPTMV